MGAGSKNKNRNSEGDGICEKKIDWRRNSFCPLNSSVSDVRNSCCNNSLCARGFPSVYISISAHVSQQFLHNSSFSSRQTLNLWKRSKYRAHYFCSSKPLIKFFCWACLYLCPDLRLSSDVFILLLYPLSNLQPLQVQCNYLLRWDHFLSHAFASNHNNSGFKGVNPLP